MKNDLPSRRRVLSAGSALLLPLARAVPLSLAFGLDACTQAEVANWVAAEQSIGQEFTVLAPEFAALGINLNGSTTIAGKSVSVNGTTVTIAGQSFTLATVGSLVQQVTAALGAASTASQGTSVLVTIETYVNAIVPLIWPVVAPLVALANPGVALTIGLVVKSLPAIEGLLNFAVDFSSTYLSGQAQQLAKLAPPAPAAMRFGGSLSGPSPIPLTPAQQALAQLMERAGKPVPKF